MALFVTDGSRTRAEWTRVRPDAGNIREAGNVEQKVSFNASGAPNYSVILRSVG